MLFLVITQCFLMVSSRIPDFYLTIRRIKFQMLMYSIYSKLNFDLNPGDIFDYFKMIGPALSYYLVITNFSFILSALLNIFFNKNFRTVFFELFKRKKISKIFK